MSDPYGDPDLVALYDVDNPDGPDHAYYRGLADELRASRILDLGCGTGLLTRSLALPGRSVTGVDPSATMLDWARCRPGADTVTWVHGDASAIPPTADLDLVLCTGNAVMHVAPDALLPAFTSIAAGLRPGGTVAFETRNPAAAAWRGWTREHTDLERDTTIGRVHEWLELAEVDLDERGEGLVRFDAHTVVPDGTDRVATSDLWFRGPATLTAALTTAGFGDPEIVGSWDGRAVTEDAPLLVVRAVRRG